MTRLRDRNRVKAILTRAGESRHVSVGHILRYAGVVVIVGGLWLLASRWIAPALITEIYHERSLGILNDLLSGRGVHPLSRYQEDWRAVARTVDIVLLATGTLVCLVWLARIAVRTVRPDDARGTDRREEPGTRLRRYLIRGALVLAGAIVGLGIGEVFVRLFPDSISEVTQGRMHWKALAVSETRSVGDPYLGFLYRPHATETLSRGDFEFSYTTDGRGFRNEWPWPERVDIVTIGDSFTFGYGVEAEETWVAHLDRRLEGRRIINLGLIGAAPQQYLRVYERFGAELHPRVVLLGLLPGGDLGDARLFDAWERAGSPGNYDIWRFFRGQTPSSARGLQGLLEKSHLYWLVWDVYGRIRNPDRFLGATVTLPGGEEVSLGLAYLEGLRSRAHPDHPDVQRVLEIVDETRALVEASGAELVVVLVPAIAEVYGPIAGIEVLDLTGLFRTQLERRGHRVVDLIPALQARGARGENLYIPEDGHWNEAGNATVADTLFRYFETNFGLTD